MANPRQRRKSRSGTHTGLSARAKRAVAKKVRKPAADVRGPEVLKQGWDRTKTVRQNYAAMGLMSSLQINPSGGLDQQDPYYRSATASSSKHTLDSDEEVEDETEQASSKPVKAGMARIVRDEEGNVVEIVEAESSNAAPAPPTDTPWGPPLNESEDEQDALDFHPSRAKRDRALHLPVKANDTAADAQPHAVHTKLDALAKELSAPVPRFTSHQEEDWLRTLVKKYGQDFESASKDRRANPWQRTAGEIKRAVRKAGGVEALCT